MPLLHDNLPDCLHQAIDCKYYSIDHYNQTFYNKNPKFSLFHHNIRSLNKHRVELQSFLDELNTNFDILALTEIGNTSVENHAKFFQKYEYFHDPTPSRCGGVSLLVSKDIEIISIRNDLCLPHTLPDDSRK